MRHVQHADEQETLDFAKAAMQDFNSQVECHIYDGGNALETGSLLAVRHDGGVLLVRTGFDPEPTIYLDGGDS